jgi:hypothetical protein
VVFTALLGKTLMIGLLMAGALRFFTGLCAGVVFTAMLGAGLSQTLMASALLGAIGMMETMPGSGQSMFADFHADLFFLRLADDRKRRRTIFAGGADQDLELLGINDLLIVIELQHVETLEASRSRRTVGQNSFHHQAEAFSQAELGSEDRRHRGGEDTDIGHRFWRRGRRMLEMAGTFGALRSTISLVPATLPAALGMVEMFMMAGGRRGR